MGEESGTVEKVIELDTILKQIALFRREAAHVDDMALAEQLEIQWSENDEERQRTTATATDRELIQYEIERATARNLDIPSLWHDPIPRLAEYLG